MIKTLFGIVEPDKVAMKLTIVAAVEDFKTLRGALSGPLSERMYGHYELLQFRNAVADVIAQAEKTLWAIVEEEEGP